MVDKDKDKDLVHLQREGRRNVIDLQDSQLRNLRRRIFNMLNTCRDASVLQRIQNILYDSKVN